MRPSRARARVARTLPRTDIEERLDEILRRGGEGELNHLRDQAQVISESLVLPGEYRRWNHPAQSLARRPNLTIRSVWTLSAPLYRPALPFFEAYGNGRVARILMNAELVAAEENRIIVPTVYRNNYLLALKALSHNKLTGALVRVLDFAQRYTAAVDFHDLHARRLVITGANGEPVARHAGDLPRDLPAPKPRHGCLAVTSL